MLNGLDLYVKKCYWACKYFLLVPASWFNRNNLKKMGNRCFDYRHEGSGVDATWHSYIPFLKKQQEVQVYM